MENNFFVLATVFVPFVGAVIALFITNNVIQRWIGVGTAALAWVFSMIVMQENLSVGPQIYWMGDWQPPFGVVFVVDMLATSMLVMSTTVMLAAFIYTLFGRDKSMRQRAFIPLFLCMETGLLGAYSTGDIFSMFVFLELLVISSVALTATSDNKLGLEAAMKYIFISFLGTLFLLLGISSIYVTFGTLNMADIAQQLGTDQRPLLANISAIMLFCAFLLKGAVFPFHFWQPDFHTTAPTPVSAVLSSIVVKIGVYGIIRLVTLLFIANADTLRFWLLLLGIVSIYFGSLAAIATYNGKRMLAYSTFAQVGFILLGIGWGTPLALAAALMYVFNHALIKSSLLMLFGIIASRTKNKTADFKDIGGVGHTLPRYVGLLYLLAGIALAGLPPMNGFVSKLALVRSGIDANSWWIVGATFASGLLTLMYMMRSWQLVFQQKPDENTAPLKEVGMNDSPIAPAILVALALIFGIFANPMFNIANRTVEQISDPQIYIDSVGLADTTTLLEVNGE